MQNHGYLCYSLSGQDMGCLLWALYRKLMDVTMKPDYLLIPHYPAFLESSIWSCQGYWWHWLPGNQQSVASHPSGCHPSTEMMQVPPFIITWIYNLILGGIIYCLYGMGFFFSSYCDHHIELMPYLHRLVPWCCACIVWYHDRYV